MTDHSGSSRLESTVSASGLEEFKRQHCNENSLISAVLSKIASANRPEPIVDVGAGLGDLSASAFSASTVIHVEPLDIRTPLPPTHRRVQCNFFDYADALEGSGTLLFSHVLQYLDSEPSRLIERTRMLDPFSIIIVSNDNTGTLGRIVAWSSRIVTANPEIVVPGFPPPAYHLREEHPLVGLLRCDDFAILASQVAAMLLDTHLDLGQHTELEAFLRSELEEPALPISQHVRVYTR